MSGISCLYSVVPFWEALFWEDGPLRRHIECDVSCKRVWSVLKAETSMVDPGQVDGSIECFQADMLSWYYTVPVRNQFTLESSRPDPRTSRIDPIGKHNHYTQYPRLSSMLDTCSFHNVNMSFSKRHNCESGALLQMDTKEIALFGLQNSWYLHNFLSQRRDA